MIHLQDIYNIIKFITLRGEYQLPEASGGEMGSYKSMGTKFQSNKMNKI